MRTKTKTPVISILVILIGCMAGFVLLSLDLEPRWVISLMILIGIYSVLRMIRDKQIFLLRLMALLMPFAVGFFYNRVVSSDVIFAFDVVLVLLYIDWFSRTNGFKNQRFYLDKITKPALFMILWSCLPIALSISKVGALLGVVFQIKSFLVYYYLIHNLDTKKKVMALVRPLVFGQFFQAGVGVLQKVTGHSLGLYFLGERKMGFRRELSRVRGTLAYPNMFGSYLVLLIPLAINLFIYYKGFRKAWYAIVVSMGFLAIALTLSRQSWLGIIIVMITTGLILLRAGRMNAQAFRAVVIVTVLAVVIGVSFWEVIMLRMQTTQVYRMMMINIALDIIKSNPILGVGLFNNEYHAYQHFSFWQPVHNEYLRLAVETGIPGLFFFLWVYIGIFREAYSCLKIKDKLLSSIAASVFSGLAGFSIIVLFDPQYQHYRHQFLFWLYAGIVFSLKKIHKTETAMALVARQEQERLRALEDLANRRSIVPSPPLESEPPEEVL